MNTIVFTSATGNRDTLREDQFTGGAEFLAFVEVEVQSSSSVWQSKQACSLFRSNRRNSRAPKILAHQFLQSEFSLWMDANVTLKVPVQTLIDEWLQHSDIAMFKHHKRDCLFAEATVCAQRELDDPCLIKEQVAEYERRGIPRNLGLPETTIILRRHTKEVENFNSHWWAEYCRYSARDQISVMCAAYKSCVHINMITPTKLEHPAFFVLNRPAGRENLQGR